MTTFDYSSGNPANLTGGATANMVDISGPFADLKVFLNGDGAGATLLGAYRTLQIASLRFTDTFAITAATYWSSSTLTSTSDNIDGSGSAHGGGAPVVIPLTSTDYAVSGLTAKLRVRLVTLTNGTAPAANFTAGLYPVSSTAGVADSLGMTLGTVVSGSTIARAAPAANSALLSNGADFTFPSTGIYALAIALSGAVATNSLTHALVYLDLHYV